MITAPTFIAQQSLFRAYDIRGAREYFTIDFIAVLGEIFANLYHSQSYYHQSHQPINNLNYRKTMTVVIGYDVRLGSDSIANTLAEILTNKGLKVIRLGLITTPMMAFWAQQYDGHGIMVTASHSAKDILGIKWLLDNTSPSSLEIQALYEQLNCCNFKRKSWYNYDLQSPLLNNCPDHNQDSNDDIKASKTFYSTEQNYTKHNSTEQTDMTSLPAKLIASRYIEAITHSFGRFENDSDSHSDSHLIDKLSSHSSPKPHSKLNFTIVIDCMNGATSTIAQLLFEHFCQRVIMLNDTPDGNFPMGNPDPTEPNRLAELQQAVIANQADMGLAFDGDGDRLMIVDNSGKIIAADHLLYLLAKVAITERSTNISHVELAPKVLFDIKCSHHLPKLLGELGATPIMTRTGSSLLRQQLTTFEPPPIFAGELSGHFIFNDGYFIAYDDAMYAGLRLLNWLAFTAPTLTTCASLYNGSTRNEALKTTDVWGELRDTLPSYQLTDITQNLPITVSSADHYLPLDKAFVANNLSDSCTIIEHLGEYCRYLQRLANDVSADELSTTQLIFAQSISCSCFDSKPPMLKTKAVAQQLLPPETRLSSIDGIRLDFAHGFGVVRRSNTSNCLTVRFAGDNLSEMRAVQARFVAICRLFDTDLAEQMATIQAE